MTGTRYILLPLEHQHQKYMMAIYYCSRYGVSSPIVDLRVPWVSVCRPAAVPYHGRLVVFAQSARSFSSALVVTSSHSVPLPPVLADVI